MDKRWKAVERGAVVALNQVLSDVGKFTPVERIPLLGREGPDLTINESGLAINVKSRQEIPARLFSVPERILFIGELACVRLCDLPCLRDLPINASTRPWKRLQDWYNRMDSWTKQNRRECISAIFLHRPQMPYGNMGVVIHFNDLRRLSCNLQSN